MNLLNVILSAVLSGIMSYVAIINMSNEKFKLKKFYYLFNNIFTTFITYLCTFYRYYKINT